MTMRKRLLLSTSIIAGLVCVVLLVLAMVPGPGITKENLNRLRRGMTPEEVEEILGKADSDSIGKNGKQKMWRHPDGSSTEVEFRDGLVSDIYWTEGQTRIQKVQRWFGVRKQLTTPRKT